MRSTLPTQVRISRRLPRASEPVSSEAENPFPSDRRYPVAAEIAYQLVRDGRIFQQGRGRSVNLSSRGILFEAETVLPVGDYIELQIAWPAKLDQRVAMALYVAGRTLRSNGNLTAVAIARYEFRTRRQALILAAAGRSERF